MKLINIYIALVIIITGCSENLNESVENHEPSMMHYSNETMIDIDDNGTIDIQSLYHQTGVDTVDEKIVLILRDKTKILHRANSIAQLNIGDIITHSENYPWSTVDPTLAIKRNFADSSYWYGTVLGETTYLGLKIYNNDSFYTAWINLTIDTNWKKIKFNYSNYCSKPNTDLIIK